MNRPVIAIFLSKLNVAGIQRMRLHLAKKFSEMGFDVRIVVRSAEGSLRDAIPNSIPVTELAPDNTVSYFPRLLNYLRREEPTHILSSYEDITMMLLLANLLLRRPAKILTSTHNALSHVQHERGILNAIKYRLILSAMPILFPKAFSVVAVSRGLATEVASLSKIPLDAVRVIYNPVVGDDFERRRDEVPPASIQSLVATVPLVGYFGRLHQQKRVDLLIQAFAKLRKNRRSKLLIVGSGPEGGALMELVENLNLSNDVIFCGVVPNPFPLMRLCSLVALSSDYEGLGNVLVEAMACGTQVVSTDCPYGPSEILQDGRLGQLVPTGDVDSLATALARSLDKDFWVEPTLLTQAAMKFSLSAAAHQYLDALGLLPNNQEVM